MRIPIISCLVFLPFLFSSFHKTGRNGVLKRSGDSPISGTPYIIIDKSDYELKIYDDQGWYATYPAVFGSKNQGDKMMEGDRKTPEGTFRVIAKRPHEKWDKMMMLDYPTAADIAKFKDRKARGLIPSNAKIGGGIGIHGTWQRDEMVIDYFQNWTNGCISLKRWDIDDLYNLIPVGTKVTIQR